jgi:hypothetical protein
MVWSGGFSIDAIMLINVEAKGNQARGAGQPQSIGVSMVYAWVILKG